MNTLLNRPRISTVTSSIFIFYMVVTTVQLVNFFVFLLQIPGNFYEDLYLAVSFLVLVVNAISVRLLFNGYEVVRWFLTLIAIFSIPFVITALVVGLTVAPSLGVMNFIFNLLIYLAIGLMYMHKMDQWFSQWAAYRSALQRVMSGY